MTDTTNTTPATTVDFAAMSSDDITTAYRAATVAEKSTMRTAVRDAITAAVNAGDITKAQSLVAANDAMTAAPKSTSSVDYAVRIADMRATLVAALSAIDAGSYTMPDGVDAPTDVDFTVGTVDAKAVVRMTTVTGRKSGRGSVADYIADTLGDGASTMTIAQLRAAWSATADYPTAAPSAGAIGACLDRDDDERFYASDVDGVKAAAKDA